MRLRSRLSECVGEGSVEEGEDLGEQGVGFSWAEPGVEHMAEPRLLDEPVRHTVLCEGFGQALRRGERHIAIVGAM